MSTYNKLAKEIKKYYERELKQYSKNKKMLETASRNNKINTRTILFLQNRIENIETVIKQLNPFEQEVFDMIFNKKYDWLYCKTIKNIDKNTYYNILNKAICMLAKEEGELLFISAKVLKETDTLEIPEGIKVFNTTIRSYNNIKSIKIPASLEEFCYAYALPTSVENIEVDSGNKKFTVENNCLYSIDKKRLIVCFTKEETVQLSNQLEIIDSYSFRAAPNLTELTLPESVTTIKGQILSVSFNSKLKKLYIGKNLLILKHIIQHI